MSKKSKERERIILEKMYGGDEKCDDGSTEAEKETESASAEEYLNEKNSVPCPACGQRLKTGTRRCPKCGYSGYIPLTLEQTVKIRLILFPVLLIIAALIYLYFRGYFG